MNTEKRRIDWMITLVPFILIMGVAGLLFIWPEQSNEVISQIRFFFGDTVGLYYLVMGVGVLVISVFLSFSKYGNIVLGEPNEKPRYSFFTWGFHPLGLLSGAGRGLRLHAPRPETEPPALFRSLPSRDRG